MGFFGGVFLGVFLEVCVCVLGFWGGGLVILRNYRF